MNRYVLTIQGALTGVITYKTIVSTWILYQEERALWKGGGGVIWAKF